MSLSGCLIRIKENRLVKHVVVLAGGTAFAQLITMLLMPVLTRLYSPEDFNVLAVYVALVSVASVAASLLMNPLVSRIMIGLCVDRPSMQQLSSVVPRQV